MVNPMTDDLGSSWVSNTPPSKQRRAHRSSYDLDDIAHDVAKNPNGPHPEDSRAVHYTEKDAAEWTYQDLYADSRAPLEPRVRRGR